MEILFQHFTEEELVILREGHGELSEPTQVQATPSSRRTVSYISPQVRDLLNAKLQRANMAPLDKTPSSSMVFYNIYDQLNTMNFHTDTVGRARHFYIICIEKGQGTLFFSTHLTRLPELSPADADPSTINVELRLDPGDVVYWTDEEQQNVHLLHGGFFSDNRVTLVARFREKQT